MSDYLIVNDQLEVDRTIQISPSVYVDVNSAGRIKGVECVDGLVDLEVLTMVLHELWVSP